MNPGEGAISAVTGERITPVAKVCYKFGISQETFHLQLSPPMRNRPTQILEDSLVSLDDPDRVLQSTVVKYTQAFPGGLENWPSLTGPTWLG